MLDAIQKLLVLQERDRRLMRIREELARIGPERSHLQAKVSGTQHHLEDVKLKAKQVETQRKELELEAESHKQHIDRYSVQQFQTRKNEEYRALTHEIQTCKDAISKLEDQQLDLMEAVEKLQHEATAANQAFLAAKKVVDDQVATIDLREHKLLAELKDLETGRAELSSQVEESARARYERLIKSKGDNVVVGVQHGVCGGCHMRLPPQIVVSCQAEQELVACPNCGRIVYFSRDMDLAVAD